MPYGKPLYKDEICGYDVELTLHDGRYVWEVKRKDVLIGRYDRLEYAKKIIHDEIEERRIARRMALRGL